MAATRAANAHRLPGVHSMISSFKRLWRDRRGNALAIAGAALPLVLGSAGLASDTIQWTLWKRQLQRAADSAAMAGVYAIASGKAVGNCTNISASTYANPVAYDLKKNYRVVGITPTCDVTNPPSVGGFTADPQAVRVEPGDPEAARLFPACSCRACRRSPRRRPRPSCPAANYCVVSLEDQAVTGINATGSTDVNLGCGMITNSTSMTAAVATGIVGSDGKPDRGRRRHSGQHALGHGHGAAAVHARAGRSVQGRSCTCRFGLSDRRLQPSRNGQSQRLSAILDTGCFKQSMDFKGTVTLSSGTLYPGRRLAHRPHQANVSCNGCTFILTNQGPELDRHYRRSRHERRRER